MDAPDSSSATGDVLFTRRFALACSMHFCGGMAASLYILFPLFVRSLGGSEFVIGVYAGLTGAAAVAARVPVGRFLDTLGRRWVLLGAGTLQVVAWLGFLSFSSLGVRSAAFVVVYGLASGSLFATYFTYASDIIPVRRRSEGFAMFGIWGMLPNGLGPLLGEFLIGRGGFPTYFVVAAGFACVALCLSALLPETTGTAHRAAARTAPRDPSFPSRTVLFLLGTAFMFGTAVESLYVFLAPFFYAHGRGSVGTFFMTYACTAVVTRVFTGRLPDRIGLRRVLIPALFLYAAGVMLVPHVGGPSALLVVGMMCGAGHGYAFPILNALVVGQVSSAYRGRAVSWLTAMFDLGNTVANPLLGAVAHWVGYTAMFSTSGLGLLVTAVVVWRRPAEGDQRSAVRDQPAADG
jgi:MFS family permease